MRPAQAATADTNCTAAALSNFCNLLDSVSVCSSFDNLIAHANRSIPLANLAGLFIVDFVNCSYIKLCGIVLRKGGLQQGGAQYVKGLSGKFVRPCKRPSLNFMRCQSLLRPGPTTVAKRADKGGSFSGQRGRTNFAEQVFYFVTLIQRSICVVPIEGLTLAGLYTEPHTHTPCISPVFALQSARPFVTSVPIPSSGSLIHDPVQQGLQASSRLLGGKHVGAQHDPAVKGTSWGSNLIKINLPEAATAASCSRTAAYIARTYRPAPLV
ncbi:hypothetical protein J6590_023422 [Homalodisca vitripennis]|nr:hypothetical protein J6590_023422 [Homalodisca vitripennis]